MFNRSQNLVEYIVQNILVSNIDFIDVAQPLSAANVLEFIIIPHLSFLHN